MSQSTFRNAVQLLRNKPSKIAFLAALLLVPTSATWAGWEVIPKIGAGLRWQDNPRQGLQNGDSATGSLIDLELDTYWKTPRSEARFTPSYLKTIYSKSEDSVLEDDNFYLPLSYEFRTARATLGIQARYSELSVRTSELETTDPDEPLSDGSGNFAQNIDDAQKRLSIDPYVRFTINQANSLTFGGSIGDVSYDSDPATSNRVDYQTNGVSGSYRHQFDPRNAVGLSLSRNTFETDPNQVRNVVETTSLTSTAFYNRVITQRTNATVTLGVGETDFETSNVGPFVANLDLGNGQSIPFCDSRNPPPADPSNPPPSGNLADGDLRQCRTEGDETNFVGGFEVRRDSELSRLQFSFNQDIRPNSEGSTNVSRLYRAFWNRKITERLNTRVGAVYAERKIIGTNATNQSIDQIRLDFRLNYDLTRHFTVSTIYRYSDVEQGNNISSDDHLFQVTMYWKGLGWRW